MILLSYGEKAFIRAYSISSFKMKGYSVFLTENIAAVRNAHAQVKKEYMCKHRLFAQTICENCKYYCYLFNRIGTSNYQKDKG